MMDRFFFIIYNSYYKHGKNEKDTPVVTVGMILGIAVFCLAMLVIAIAYMITSPELKRPFAMEELMPVLFLYCILYYLLVVKNKKYNKIYNLYKENEFLNSRTARLLAWSIVFISILSPFIFAYLKVYVFT